MNYTFILEEDRIRKIMKVVDWAQKHKIKVEKLTLEELRMAIKSRQ
jgi:hypothetical protein